MGLKGPYLYNSLPLIKSRSAIYAIKCIHKTCSYNFLKTNITSFVIEHGVAMVVVLFHMSRFDNILQHTTPLLYSWSEICLNRFWAEIHTYAHINVRVLQPWAQREMLEYLAGHC